jgi:hypothetical protein
VILLSLFGILILVLLPALYFLLKRLDINLKKYQFWVMGGTGISWLISLLVYLSSPQNTLNLIWDISFQLLPGSIITLDSVSSGLILGLTSIIFSVALFQEQTPEQLAWISGLGGVCTLGMLADSPFTLISILTLIEIIMLFNFINSELRFISTRRKLLSVIGRLLSPFMILYAMLIGGAQDPALTFSEYNPTAGPILVAAGLIGALGWFDFLGDKPGESAELIPTQISDLLPAATGLLVMVKGAALTTNGLVGVPMGLILGLVVLVFVLGSFIFFTPEKSWIIGMLGIIAGAAILGKPQLSLIWCLVFILSGFLLRKDPVRTRGKLIFLVFGGLGLVCLPFLPAWTGIAIFGSGARGYLFAAAFGLASGRILEDKFSRLTKKDHRPEEGQILLMIAPVFLFISLSLFAIQNDLISVSIRLTDVSLSSWLPVIIMVLMIIFGGRLPNVNRSIQDRISKKLDLSTRKSLNASSNLVDQVIIIFKNIFEGDGGLIWALLIGFLIFTLISIGRG